ncbi:hypothetical protein [Nocardia sp. NPDC052112]|uniref:hypothetical protein n=1 Tax=Nocardia sp. NPDC052112 TaxID=3155646 RepID=UPI003443CE00
MQSESGHPDTRQLDSAAGGPDLDAMPAGPDETDSTASSSTSSEDAVPTKTVMALPGTRPSCTERKPENLIRWFRLFLRIG